MQGHQQRQWETGNALLGSVTSKSSDLKRKKSVKTVKLESALGLPFSFKETWPKYAVLPLQDNALNQGQSWHLALLGMSLQGASAMPVQGCEELTCVGNLNLGSLACSNCVTDLLSVC